MAHTTYNGSFFDVFFFKTRYMNEEKIDDALFYRDVSYVIYVPKNFGKDVLHGKNPEIKIKSTVV